MTQLGLIFQNLSHKEIKNSFKERTRKDIIDEFYEIIIKQAKEEQEIAKRKKAKVYPLPRYMVIRNKLDGLKTVAELEWYLGYCREAKHFSKCFYSQLRVDKK
ncbi:MAG: hypothetical protein ACP5N7_07020 [Candidatus Pacearchaeota archaeon]